MKIDNDRTIEELQKEFSAAFPYLKIEFFKKPHPKGEASDEQEIWDNHLTLGAIRDSNRTGDIALEKSMTVEVFEQTLAADFDLFAQIYRKSHGRWLQTWVTDVWTLGEQNNRGIIMNEDSSSSVSYNLSFFDMFCKPTKLNK